MTYAPPSLAPDHLDHESLVSPPIVKLGGALLGAAGFFVTGSALQVAALFPGVLHGVATLPLWVLGGAALVVGPTMFNGRGWAAVLGTVVSACAAIATGLWALYALGSFVFAPMLVLGVGSSVLAAVASPFAILPAIRLSRTRRELYA
jgi:hypothetical protein